MLNKKKSFKERLLDEKQQIFGKKAYLVRKQKEQEANKEIEEFELPEPEDTKEQE